MGKLYVFVAAIKGELYLLAVIGVLASVVGAYYYLRIVKIMFFDEPAAAFEPAPSRAWIVLMVTGLFVIVYGLYPTGLVAMADQASRSFF
jgi:NADH-quinone oxidoreductase subunit N